MSYYNKRINVRETRRRDPESRDTGNNEYTRHRTKTNKTKNTTQKTKKISNTDATKNPGVNTGAREGYAVVASYNTPAVLLI